MTLPPEPSIEESGYFLLGVWQMPFWEQLRRAVEQEVEDGLRRMAEDSDLPDEELS